MRTNPTASDSSKLKTTAGKLRARWAWTLSVASVLSCSSDQHWGDAGEADQSALSANDQRVLGFERVSATPSASDWTLASGSSGVLSQAMQHTEGLRSLGVSNLGWVQLVSSRIGPLGSVSQKLSLDLLVPGSGLVPWGDLQAFVDAPSLGLHHRSVGQKLLGSTPRGVFQRIELPIASDIVTKLSSPTYSDLSVRVTLSVPTTTQPVLVDNISFTATSGSGGTGGSGTGGASGASGASGKGGSGSGGGGSGGTSGNAGKSTSGGSGGSSAGSAGSAMSGTGGSSGGSNSVQFFIELPRGVDRRVVALASHSAGSLVLNDAVDVVSASGSFASVSSVRAVARTELGVGADVLHLWSQSGVLLRNDAVVHGNLITQGLLEKQVGARVEGSTRQQMSLEPVQRQAWPVVFAAPNRGAVNLEPGQSRTVTPGSFAGANLKSGTTLTFAGPGVYTFDGSFFSETGNSLVFQNGSGPIQVYVRNGFTFRGSINKAQQRPNVLIGAAGTQEIPIEGSLDAILVAPHARVALATRASGHRGSVFARQILHRPNTTFRHAPFDPSEFCTTSSACSGLCPCEDDECQNDDDCEPGKVCALGAGARHGKPRGTNVCADPVCITEPDEHCGFPDAPCGSCDNGVPCDGDADCSGGEICGFDRGRGLGLSFPNVCLPPICVSDPVAGGCGTEGSACGRCPCEKSCATKQCGDDPSDGCGGRCVGFCDNRAAGCETDGDCPVGNACIIGGGPRIGLPEGANVCLSATCTDPNPRRLPCGSIDAECGLCPQAPANVCAGLQCGEDPSYGVSCGSVCSTGEACVLNRCVPGFSAAALELGSVSPITRERRMIPPLSTLLTARTVPGALDGRFAVSRQGSATYSVPIVLPPGRAGLVPSISLNYASGAPNGLLGTGWSIGGLSAIARCPKIAARNGGMAQPVTDTDSDDLCLDGHPLVLIGGTHFAGGAEYRTEVDTFNRIRIVAAGDQISFRVEKRDGRILTYGGNTRSRIHRAFGEKARAWVLSEIRDRVGNYIEFSYGSFGASGNLFGLFYRETVEFWPVEIAYGGAQSASVELPHSRRVRFHYSDTRFDYLDGSAAGGGRVVRSKRLDRIETLVSDRLVRSYELTHEEASVGWPRPTNGGGPSRVTHITECSFQTGVKFCTRPTTFTYTDRRGLLGGDLTVQPQYSSIKPLERGPRQISYAGPFVVLDTNGDGRDDVLGNGKILLATGNREQGSEPFTEVLVGETADFPRTSQGDVLDFDQDGRDDFLATPDQVNGREGYRLWIYRSTGDAASPFQRVPVANVSYPSGTRGSEAGDRLRIRTFLADLDGDGIKDLFECVSDDLIPKAPQPAYYQRGLPGGGFDSEQRGRVAMWGSCGQWWAPPEPVHVVDLDGDGVDEILTYSGYGEYIDHPLWARYSPKPDGTAEWLVEENLPLELADAGADNLVRFIDVNGDGLKDIYALLGNSEPFLFINRGRRFESARTAYGAHTTDPHARYTREYLDYIQGFTRASPYSVERSLVIDYDGDGREDLLRLFEPREGDPASTKSLWQLDWAAMHRVEFPESGLPFLGADGTAADPIGLIYSHFAPQPNVAPARFPLDTWGDVDGDGSLDLLQIAEDGRLAVTHGEFGHENLLSSVTNGLGARIDISYAAEQTFTEGARRTYTKATKQDPAEDFTLCARQRGPLASRYSLSQYVDELGDVLVDRVFTLRYEGGRAGFLGRGWLGFDRRFIEETTADGALVESTEITEDNRTFSNGLYPFAGLEQSRLVLTGYARSAIEGRTTRRATSTFKGWNTRLSSAGVPFPFADDTTVMTWDEFFEGFAALPTVFTDSDVDEYGNVIREETLVEWQDAISSATTIETDFDVREGSWLIGLPSRRTTTSVVIDGGESRSETRTQDFTFDDFGLLESTTREPEAGAAGGLRLTTRYEREPSLLHGIKSIVTFGSWLEDVDDVVNGIRRTTVEYDADLIFPEHVYQHHGTDSCGNQNAHTAECQTSDVRYDPRTGLLLTRVDPTGVGERFEYDAFGRMVRHEGPADVVRTTFEDATAAPDLEVPVYPKLEVTTVSEGSGAVSTQRFDAFGRVVQTQTLGLGGAQVLEETEYRFGSLVSRKSRPHLAGDTSQGVVTQEFDERFRLFRQRSPDGTFVEFLYATVNTVYPSDSGPDDWRVVSVEPGEVFVGGVIDGNLNTAFQFHSARGALRRVADEKAASTRYLYGPFDVLIETVDAAGRATTIVPDGLGRILSISDGNTADFYQYTAFGEVHTHDNWVGSTRRQYDDLGRLETTVAAEGQTSFAYDGPQPNAIGRIASSVGATGHAEEYHYEAPPASDDPMDNRGLLASVHRLLGGRALTTSMTYAGGGLLASVTYPPSADEAPTEQDQFVLHYGYEAGGHLKCVSTAPLQGDDCGPEPLWRREASYQGQFIEAERFGNGVRTDYGYEDLTGRLTEISTERASTNLQNIRHTFYDGNGNLRFRTQSFLATDGSRTNFDEEFRYDATNQLYAIFGDGPTQLLTYDETGNILSNSEVGDYDYSPNQDELAGPHAVRRILRDGEAVTSFQYDQAGNVREREGERVLGGFQTLQHTSFNLPSRISVGEGPGARHYVYEYDAHQSRVRLGVDNDGNPDDFEEERLYVGSGYERHRLEDAGGEVVRHVYKVLAAGRQVAEIARERRGGTTSESRRYIHADHLGSSQLVTDEDGELVRVQRFHPFGASEPVSGSSTDPAARLRAGFTGHESDLETGLVNMQGRIYDPQIGRFLQADPLAEPEAGSIWANRYAYAANNPLKWTDPTGFAIDPDSPYFREPVAPIEMDEMVIEASPVPTAAFPLLDQVPTADESDASVGSPAALSPQVGPTSAGGPDYADYVASVVAGRGDGGVNVPGLGESSDSSDRVGSSAQSDGDARDVGMETTREDSQAGHSGDLEDFVDMRIPADIRGPDQRLACGPACVVPIVFILWSISGDTDEPGSGSEEYFTLGASTFGAGRMLGLGSTAARGIPQIVQASNGQMLGQAIGHVKGLAGTAAEKANLFQRLAGQINQLSGGSWAAARGVGTEGSHVFLGRAGEALVINPAGQLFRGSLQGGGISIAGPGRYAVNFAKLKGL